MREQWTCYYGDTLRVTDGGPRQAIYRMKLNRNGFGKIKYRLVKWSFKTNEAWYEREDDAGNVV